MVSFKQFMESREAPGGMDLTANVLMVSYWPTYQPMAVNLLPEVGTHRRKPEDILFFILGYSCL